MNVIGEKMKHKTMGIGIVIEQEEGVLTIEFPKKVSKFPYNEVTFTKFLLPENSMIQELLLKEFQERKLAEEKKQLEVLNQQKDIRMITEEKCELKKTFENFFQKKERMAGKRMTFYVFQGSTFDRESRGGYIWAPVSNSAGKRFHHWDRLLEVEPGDIIFHGYNGYVQAISVVKDRCYECNQPEELRTENMWDQEGRRVDCEYIMLKHPIKTADYTSDILRFCNVKYAPFNKFGTGNMGYLYELNRELAKIFLRDIVKINPILLEVSCITEILSEK